MTWLSRLLPQSPSLRLADRNNRTRQAQRRRRMATLESLEDRTLLSTGNVVTSIAKAPTGQYTLTITGDAHSDNYSIVENSPSHTVTINGSVKGSNITTVNGLSSFTTLVPITDIYITIPANIPGPPVVNNTSAFTNTISLTGKGVRNVTVNEPGYSATNPAPELDFTATSVTNTGFLTINDGTPATPTATPPGPGDIGGTLKAAVTGSQFTALTINQVGCCQATVGLTGDTVTGAVTVNEGTSDNDSVTGTGDQFGPTTITQFAYPTQTSPIPTKITPTSNTNTGKNDIVTFDDTVANAKTGLGGVFSLAIEQDGKGGGQSILVGTTSEVEVASTGFGITAKQPNALGAQDAIPIAGTINSIPAVPGDVIHIESITVYGRPSSVTAIGQPSILTLQGNGKNETTTVDSSTVAGNITVTQGDGTNDIVHIANDVIGTATTVGNVITDTGGLLSVTQGNGPGDLVIVDSNGSEPGVNAAGNVFNNVVIQQGTGNNPATPDITQCPEAVPFNDVVVFEEATVNDNLVIVQNGGFTAAATGLAQGGTAAAPDGTGFGNDLVEIGGNPEGVTYPDGTPVVAAQVIVDGNTYVFQGGQQNVTDLGGAGDISGIDFETNNLDIWTGAGGGSVVTAQNTYVDNGSQFAGVSFVINGGGLNAYSDGGGNSTTPLALSSTYTCVFGC